MHRLSKRPSPATVISLVALFVSLGGSSYAAVKINGKNIKSKSISGAKLKSRTVTAGKVKRNTLTGTEVNESKLGQVPSAQNATNATNATNASNASNSSKLGGSPASDYQQLGATLPSGRTEAGDYGIRSPNTSTAGFLDLSVSFQIPLAARIPAANVVYTTVAGTTHCSGPGTAERGFLCIYQANSSNVNTPANVEEFEDQLIQNGSGKFGFNMEWTVTGTGAFSIGTWAVTAP